MATSLSEWIWLGLCVWVGGQVWECVPQKRWKVEIINGCLTEQMELDVGGGGGKREVWKYLDTQRRLMMEGCAENV